jgi:tRNA(Ile)-lysidine synthase
MLHVFPKIPYNSTIGLACSGGIDSMVALDFLLDSKSKFKRDITLFHVNHGTEHGKLAEEFVRNVSEKYSLKLIVYNIIREKERGESLEEFWRNERYKFFHSFPEIPIITAHHLQDIIETWIMTSLRGDGKLINYSNGNVIRPFLKTSKKEIEDWQKKNCVEFIQDHSNFENVHDRNIVRNEMMPIVLKLNPGIEKTIKKKVIKCLHKS